MSGLGDLTIAFIASLSVNLIVMGPGAYRFGEYWKLGRHFVVATFLVPVIWPF